MHTSFDFEGDGYDYALRSIAPVDLIVDPGYTIDYAGTSNTCASCHQPRTAPPVDNGMGLFQVTSTHWGPHHGPQATLLEGIQGAEIEGDVEYPDPASAGHRKGASCTSCHMGESDGDINGLHTWVPTTSDCAKCHSNGIPEEVGGFKEDMATLLTQLEEIGILHSEVVDDVLEVHPVPGTYDILAAEAAWNYILIYEDASGGTHNPKYAKALIQNSIEALNNAD
jgi:hypothetical protein